MNLLLSSYNDGANYPNSTEGVGPMHRSGCNAVAIAGNVDYFKVSTFGSLSYPPNHNTMKGPRPCFIGIRGLPMALDLEKR